MACCWSLVCYVLLAGLVELHFHVVRGILRYIGRLVERYTAPVINVPRPNLTLASAKRAPEPLKPSLPDQPGVIQCFDKGLNVPLGTVKVVTPDQLAVIVGKARKAQVAWAASSFSTRRKLLFSLLDYVVKHHKFICETSAVECGKTMVDGTFGEILTTLEKLTWTATHGESVLADEYRSVGLITMHKHAVVRYVPFGVIGAIVSWNYPFHNIWGPMISALFSGNAFVGKVSEFSSYYASYYESIVKEALRSLGYSPDLVTFATGFAETGSALVSLVDKVTFIGSPGVGKLVMKRASETLTPVVLELGGKDPAIVCEDADLNQVVHVILRGTFQNCGQNCVGLERVVVHHSIHDKLVAMLKPYIENMTQGPTLDPNNPGTVCDLGAMTMGTASVVKIQKLLDETVAAGAKLVVGGKATKAGFFPPTLITNVTSKMPIAVDEVFGPILVLMTFRTDDEAIALVNDCPYGLGSSVFSNNVQRAKYIGQRLHTGMMNVNDFGINYLCQSLPFGGCKISGFDRFAGIEGLRGNCIPRAETYDRIPGVKTAVPPALQYPLKENSFDFSMLLARVLYGRLPQMLSAIVQLATFKPKPARAA